MRILIADSDEELLDTLQSYMRKRGHDVRLASNGMDCIKSLCESVPDIVVLDHGLLWGGCDGVLSVLRDNPLLAVVPVILIADSQSQYDVLATTNVVAWLQKPFSLGDLEIRIASDSESIHLSDCSSLPTTRLDRRDDRDSSRTALMRRLNPKQMMVSHRRMPDHPR